MGDRGDVRSEKEGSFQSQKHGCFFFLPQLFYTEVACDKGKIEPGRVQLNCFFESEAFSEIESWYVWLFLFSPVFLVLIYFYLQFKTYRQT